MLHQRLTTAILVGSLTLGTVVGCESLPGGRREQGTVIGGAAGAAAGAALAGSDNRLLGALIGGAVGAGGGYLVGANWDRITGEEREDAIQANERAQQNPARPEDVAGAETADLNSDGFVTLDEVVAMREAGLSDSEMISRLEATDQYFELSSQQEQYLRERGVSRTVITAMREMDRETSRLAAERVGEQRISRERN
jgi:hypothetical protein